MGRGPPRAVRRRLHGHTEAVGQEHETTALVAAGLAEAGLRPRPLSCGIWMICDVGTGDRPVIALRAGLDALTKEQVPTGQIELHGADPPGTCGARDVSAPVRCLP